MFPNYYIRQRLRKKDSIIASSFSFVVKIVLLDTRSSSYPMLSHRYELS